MNTIKTKIPPPTILGTIIHTSVNTLPLIGGAVAFKIMELFVTTSGNHLPLLEWLTIACLVGGLVATVSLYVRSIIRTLSYIKEFEQLAIAKHQGE